MPQIADEIHALKTELFRLLNSSGDDGHCQFLAVYAFVGRLF